MHMIEGILEQILRMMIDECPHGDRLVFQIIRESLSLIVAQKRSILARVNFNSYECQHSRVELKHRGHLHVYHADQVEELSKNGASLLIFVIFVLMPVPASELMAIGKPLFFD